MRRSPLQDFETIYRCLFPGLLSTVPPWFTSDVQQGVLTLHMTYPQAFSAELYAQAIGMACPDDVKLNYGHQLLTAMFTVWRLKCEGRPVDPAILCAPPDCVHLLLGCHLRTLSMYSLVQALVACDSVRALRLIRCCTASAVMPPHAF